MSRSSSTRVFVYFVCVALVAGVGLFVWWPPPSPGIRPAISIIGVTNDPAKGLSVLFGLTNQSASRMNYAVCRPQIKIHGIWSPLRYPRAGRETDLSPHQATNFMVEIPSDKNAWRVPVLFGYWPAGAERLRGTILYNLRLNWIRLRYHRSPMWVNNFEIYLYASYSPELSNRSNDGPKGTSNLSQPIRAETNQASSAVDFHR